MRGITMGSACFKTLKRFFLLTILIGTIAGCGSGSSSANSNTGSIAAKLTWSSSGAKTSAKTVYLTPSGVTNVRLTVSGVGISPNIIADFPATAGTAGSGTINGVPAGTGRTVKAEGMDQNGIIRFQGSVTGIPVVAGTVTDAGVVTMSAPTTTASPAGGTYGSAQTVTLTSDTPATIFYTTSLLNPYTNGGSQPTISIPVSTTLSFYAIDSGFAQEQTRTEIYTITP